MDINAFYYQWNKMGLHSLALNRRQMPVIFIFERKRQGEQEDS